MSIDPHLTWVETTEMVPSRQTTRLLSLVFVNDIIHCTIWNRIYLKWFRPFFFRSPLIQIFKSTFSNMSSHLLFLLFERECRERLAIAMICLSLSLALLRWWLCIVSLKCLFYFTIVHGKICILWLNNGHARKSK